MAPRERDASRGGGAKRARTAVGAAAAAVVEPPELVCPIARELFRDPVTTAAGNTYERVALLQAWAQRGYEGPRRDPLTNAPLASRKLYPCWLARRLVSAFLEAHPAYVPDGWPDREVPPPLQVSDNESDHARRGGAVAESDDDDDDDSDDSDAYRLRHYHVLHLTDEDSSGLDLSGLDDDAEEEEDADEEYASDEEEDSDLSSEAQHFQDEQERNDVDGLLEEEARPMARELLLRQTMYDQGEHSSDWTHDSDDSDGTGSSKHARDRSWLRRRRPSLAATIIRLDPYQRRAAAASSSSESRLRARLRARAALLRGRHRGPLRFVHCQRGGRAAAGVLLCARRFRARAAAVADSRALPGALTVAPLSLPNARSTGRNAAAAGYTAERCSAANGGARGSVAPWCRHRCFDGHGARCGDNAAGTSPGGAGGACGALPWRCHGAARCGSGSVRRASADIVR